MLGIDIVNISRFQNKSDRFYSKLFSDQELNESKKGNFYQKLAGKWAAKEAAYKAGLFFLSLKDIEILTFDNKPYILIEKRKTKHMLSISHDGDYATAIVFKNV